MEPPDVEAGVSLKQATVTRLVSRSRDLDRVDVLIDGACEEERAIAYRIFTPRLKVGDRVIVNSMGVELGLGTGGTHFVVSLCDGGARVSGTGHIVKLRYTPLQVKVLAVEEEDSPHHRELANVPDLGGKPVLVGSLHSMVPIAAATVKARRPDCRVAYVMTDGAALPAAFSRLIPAMRRSGLVEGVVTAGHAFGGDLEAVNVPSAISCAHAVMNADVIVVAMGPGVVGTATPLGTSALEVGPALDAAGALNATPIAIPRLSEAETRPRHLGISHHTMNALTRFAHVEAHVPLPCESRPRLERQAEMLKEAGRRVIWVESRDAYAAARLLMVRHGLSVTSMWRRDKDDPLFFHGVAAAASYAAERI